jgi:glutathione S-transferase
MDGPDLQHIAVNLRSLQSATIHSIVPEATTLSSQLATNFDPNGSQVFQPFSTTSLGNLQQHLTNPFVRPPRPGEPNNLLAPSSGVSVHRQQITGGDPHSRDSAIQFAVPSRHLVEDGGEINPQVNQNPPILQNQTLLSHGDPGDNQGQLLPSLEPSPQQNSFDLLQRDADIVSAVAPHAGKSDVHFGGMKMIPNPPDLQAWREKLFNVDETITMTEEQYVSLLSGINGPASLTHLP